MKLNYDIDKNNQTSLSFYLGKDKLDYSRDGNSLILDWGNQTFSAQWTHLFSSKLFSHFVLAGSQFQSDNVWFRTWKSWENPAVVEDYTMLPFLPTGGVSIQF